MSNEFIDLHSDRIKIVAILSMRAGVWLQHKYFSLLELCFGCQFEIYFLSNFSFLVYLPYLCAGRRCYQVKSLVTDKRYLHSLRKIELSCLEESKGDAELIFFDRLRPFLGICKSNFPHCVVDKYCKLNLVFNASLNCWYLHSSNWIISANSGHVTQLLNLTTATATRDSSLLLNETSLAEGEFFLFISYVTLIE